MPFDIDMQFNLQAPAPLDTRMSGTSTQTAALSNLAQGLTRYETNTDKFMVNTASNSAAWKRIPILTSGNGGKTLGVNTAGTEWEFKDGDGSVPTEYLTETEGNAAYHPLTNVDSAATESSTNLVTSGAMFTALAGKHPSTAFDSAATENSTNLVTSGAMFTALAGKASTADLTNGLNGKHPTINTSSRLDANLIHDGTVSNTEFGYLGGVTSDIQTQLNACLTSFTIPSEYLTQTEGETLFVSQSELASKQDEITHAARLSASLVGSSNTAPADAVTDAEFAYLSGLNGNIQGQLNLKADKSGTSSITTSSYVQGTGLYATTGNDQVGFAATTVGSDICLDLAARANSTGSWSTSWRFFKDVHNNSVLRGMASNALHIDTYTSGGNTGYVGLRLGKPNNYLWAYIEKWDTIQGRWEFHQINTGFGFAASDDRIKYHEQPISSALSVVRQLQPKKYRKHARIMTEAEERAMEADPDAELPDVSVNHDERTTYMHCPKREAGFIAQDVLKIPELAHAVKQNAEGPMELQYNDVFTYAVAAIKELDALVSTLRTTVNQQTTQISSLQRRIQALES